MATLIPNKDQTYSKETPNKIIKNSGLALSREGELFPEIKKPYAYNRINALQRRELKYVERTGYKQNIPVESSLQYPPRNLSALSSYSSKESNTAFSELISQRNFKRGDRSVRNHNLAKNLRTNDLGSPDSVISGREYSPASTFSTQSSTFSNKNTNFKKNNYISVGKSPNINFKNYKLNIKNSTNTQNTNQAIKNLVSNDDKKYLITQETPRVIYSKQKGKDTGIHSHSDSDTTTKNSILLPTSAMHPKKHHFIKKQGFMNDDGTTSSTVCESNKNGTGKPIRLNDIANVSFTPTHIKSYNEMKTPHSLADSSKISPLYQQYISTKDEKVYQKAKKYTTSVNDTTTIEPITTRSCNLEAKSLDEKISNIKHIIDIPLHPSSFDENAVLSNQRLYSFSRHKRFGKSKVKHDETHNINDIAFLNDLSRKKNPKTYNKLNTQNTYISQKSFDNNKSEPLEVNFKNNNQIKNNYSNKLNENAKVRFDDNNNEKHEIKNSKVGSGKLKINQQISSFLTKDLINAAPQNLPQTSIKPSPKPGLEFSDSRVPDMINQTGSQQPNLQKNSLELPNTDQSFVKNPPSPIQIQPNRFESKQTIHNNLDLLDTQIYNEQNHNDSDGYIISKKIKMKRIRVQRDYSFEECCQFYTSIPNELVDKIDITIYTSFIVKLNEMLADAEGSTFLNVMEGLLTCALAKVTTFIEESNRLIFNPAGYAVLNPRQTAFIFLEVIKL
ncbi:hypothetical protein BB561_002688 [Smittium simulii]|uniref:Ras modification protein ERF4 n=1 Tax=Smittium simulii TaxID=133385 RepID=A0A2T9YPG9_9FUNG|nr:hypothetical protein BB561_002688 [Smittium simulii]